MANFIIPIGIIVIVFVVIAILLLTGKDNSDDE